MALNNFVIKQPFIGTDTSFYAERVKSYEQMALHADFTIIRAGQGSWIDNYFEKNRSAAKGILPRGAYWFYDNRYKPQRQADLYQAALGDDLMESYLWCDWEKQHHSQEPRFDSWVNFLDFLRHTKRAFPTKTIGIYTGYYWFNEKVPADKRYLFAEYPLWLGNYNPWDRVKAPEPWGKVGITLWQFTEGGDGEKYGLDPLVKRAIDLNRYLGAYFEEFLGEPPITSDEPADEPDAPPTIPDAPDGLVAGKLLEGMNLRTAPIVSDNQIGYLFKHTEVSGVLVPEDDNSWLEMNAGAFGNLYVAEYHNGLRYIQIEKNDTTQIVRTGIVPTNTDKRWFYFTPDNPPRQSGGNFTYPGNQLPYPQTIKTMKKELWLPLPEKWQWFQYDLLKLDAPGMSEAFYLEAYESLVADHRAFTDLHNKDDYTDYVLGRNLDRNEPYFWKVSLSCKGNIGRGYANGSELVLDGFDITQNPPKAEDVYHERWRVHYANQVYPQVLANGWAKVTHFPQIKVNGDKTGTSIPFFGTVNMPKNITQELSPGEEYRIVNLERDQT